MADSTVSFLTRTQNEYHQVRIIKLSRSAVRMRRIFFFFFFYFFLFFFQKFSSINERGESVLLSFSRDATTDVNLARCQIKWVRSFSHKDPVPTAANPDKYRTPVACASFADPPDPDARGSSDDVRDGGGDDGGSADDPAEAANRDPLLRRRPRRRPELGRRRTSLVERVEPSSGDRPGCRLIRGSFEADRPYLSSPVHHRFPLPLPPR